MLQKFDHVPQKILVTGGSGTGKTTKAEKLMRQEKARWKFVYDHDGQFASRFGYDPVNSAGLDAAVAKGGWIVFDPADDFEDDFSKGLDFYSDYILAISKEVRGRKLFYVDELDLLTTSTTYPRSLVAVMQTGRRYQIDCVFISAQPNNLHNRVRTQFTEVHTFLHTDAAALKFLVENGIEEQRIRDLGEHGWISRHLRTGVEKSNLKRNVATNDDPGKAAA